jgi:putative endonuclease
MAWVYILKSDLNDRFYVGSTTDIERRMDQHRNHHTPTTHRMGVLELVFKQEYLTLAEAREIERRLKNLKRKDYLQKIIDEGVIRMRIE